ncbi:siderophore ABC transporter substrate-binding protein [Arenibaculum pallidiluteum]|uniref:siderophore ABC transporter substrate-binding protein n=1 Tax=Arenibaculum pallidiluteum TaxID=2812559 RepID=UPI001A9592B6|nr:siderophore ABC transporter substrate-binding protein [Arenibaculum pallidiluteum]
MGSGKSSTGIQGFTRSGTAPRSPARRPRLFAALAAAAAMLAAMPGLLPSPAAAKDTVSVQHAQGTTEIPARPQRVVVFDLSALDTLDAMGVKVAGVPGGIFPEYLAHYKDASHPKVGSLFEPDFEAVTALEPDLIVVGSRSAPKLGELSRIAPTIDLTTDAKDQLGSVRRNVTLLGRIFGKEQEAAARLAKLDESVAAVRRDAADAGKALLVLVTGNKISAYGPGSRFGMLHTVLGVPPAAPDLKISNHGEAISSEFILRTNPDWLFVIDRDAAIGTGAARQVLENELVASTKAAKSGRIVYLDSASWYVVGGGITSMQNAVDQVANVLRRAN